MVLAAALAGAPGDVDAALQRHERRRRPDAHALGTMDHQVRGMRTAPVQIAFACTGMLIPMLSFSFLLLVCEDWAQYRYQKGTVELQTAAARTRRLCSFRRRALMQGEPWRRRRHSQASAASGT